MLKEKKSKKKKEKNEDSSADESLHAESFPITILIESIENVDPQFPATDVFVVVQHQTTIIGQTENKYVLDKTFVELDTKLKYCYNINLSKELDKLLTFPLYFLCWQSLNKLEYENLDIIYPELEIVSDDILSSHEMILGVKDKEVTYDMRTRKKSKSSTKPAKDKTKSSTRATTKVSLSSIGLCEDPICIGSGTLDLLPLFKGETEIYETIPIYQKKLFIDERFKHASLCPQLKVKVTIKEPLFEIIDKVMANLFQISFEAMYNIPDDLNESYDFKLATVYPMESMTLEQFYFDQGMFKSNFEAVGQLKFWPNLSTIDDLGTQTKQIINQDLTTIKNKLDIDVEDIVDSKPSRIVWNSMKRSWLSIDSNEYLKQLITRFRNWPIEIKMTPTSKKGTSTTKTAKNKDKKSNEASSSVKVTKSKQSLRGGNIPFPYHLMAFADVSTLLYPGVTKTRVLCPVYNFCLNHLTQSTGYTSSCFSHYTKTVFPTTVDAGDKDGDKETKSPTKEEKTSKSNKKEKGNKGEKEPAASLQNENCELELVHCNDGGICFIIVEAELMCPFMKMRTIEDLTDELMTIIPKRTPLPKSVIPMRVAVNIFKTTICEMTREINKEFQYYTQELDIKKKVVTTPCFIKYLQDKGSYQKLLMTIERSISLLIKEKYKYTAEQQTEYMYDNYISMIYVYLVNEMNKQINSIMNCNLSGCSARKIVETDYLYLCDEAIELNIPVLAEKYHLQVMKDNHRDPDKWFNLAVFYKGQKFNDRAYECCKEGIALKSNHKLCLLLFAGMLYEKQDYSLAETTLLAVLNHYPECLEGWVGLYVVYYYKTKFEGCDICMEYINKYKSKVIQIQHSSPNVSDTSAKLSHEDNFKIYEPLSWSTQIAAKTPFFHCAITFIKMQNLKFAEQCLLFDSVAQKGEHKYYLGVIKYFQEEYTKALDILQEAQKIHGPDFAVNSMIGHCSYRLGNFPDAKEAYEFIVCAYNRPDDMHMLYTNLALIYEKENNLEMARKYLLIVCKLSPTPYSWLLLGIVFFKEEKLKESEACITESNNLDNRLPETWAYLVLINIKLGKIWEAQQCFSQMMKYDLQDKSLLALVVIEMKMANNNES